MAQKLKKKTWSDKTEWEGFRPPAYSLDSKKIWELPIEIRSAEEQKEQTTIGQVLTRLREASLLEFEGGMGVLTVKMTSGEISCTGLSFNLSLLESWLNLHKRGANAFYAQFFYYDSDAVTDDPHERYTFFIVYDNKIVDEQQSFSDYRNSGFDPSVFVAEGNERRIWFNDNYWQQAWVRFCYRKFYAETRIGQLMVLRPDQPELYYYPEGRSTNPTAFSAVQSQLERIRWLLIVLIAIGLVLVYLAWH